MKVALGVTGGIAAYKAAELVRLLQDRGLDVQVVMTRAACQFVTPLTFAALSGHKVITGMFGDAGGADPNVESAIEHIAVAQSIDALADAAPDGAEALRPHALTPDFQLIRALAIEAYYSDFLAPGAPGPTAYEEIDFHSPLAMRIKKDWSYLGVMG